MAADHETGQWQCGYDDIAVWWSDSISENGHVVSERRIYGGQPAEKEAPGGDERELDDCQSDWFVKGIEDFAGGSISDHGGNIPSRTHELILQLAQ
jgi:hypothetical protein